MLITAPSEVILCTPGEQWLDHGEADCGKRQRGGLAGPFGGPAGTIRQHHSRQGSPCQGIASPTQTTGPHLDFSGADMTAVAIPQVINTEAQAQAWREFIGRYPMQWFSTFTFKEDVHPERATKLFRLFVRKLNRHLYGNHFERKGQQGVFWVLAWEYQKRGVLHFHSLLGDVEDLNIRARRLHWMDQWEALGPPAGFARIEKIESQDAVRNYVTKYVTKGGQIDLSLSLRSFAQQQSLSNPAR